MTCGLVVLISFLVITEALSYAPSAPTPTLTPAAHRVLHHGPPPPFSITVTEEMSCNISTVFYHCFPFFTGMTRPDEECCAGVDIALKAQAECVCESLKSLEDHFGVLLNFTKVFDLATACHLSLSVSIISKCDSGAPSPPPPAPAPVPAPAPSNDTLVNPTLVTIDDGAVCLAGNPAAYYYSKGFGEGINNWMVYLREGGWCMNVSDCEHYVSNKGIGMNPKAASFEYMLSNQKHENPDFFNWNKVDVRYCDASSFTGNSEIIENGTKLYFRGARIFKAVMQELLQKGMGNARNALLAGSSAGGVATTIYCDRFRDLFPSTSRVKCFSDGGYFFLAKNHIEENTFLSDFEGLIKLHGSKDVLPKSCTSRLSPELCFFPPNLQADISTPIFFLMSAFDIVQINYTVSNEDELTICILGRNCTSNQMKSLKDLRAELLTTLPQQSSSKGFLITSPYTHTQVRKFTWNSLAAGTNETIAELVGDWYFDRKHVQIIDKNSCPYKCTS